MEKNFNKGPSSVGEKKLRAHGVELGSQLMQTALFLNFDNLLIKN
jgi:hypothetical protein